MQLNDLTNRDKWVRVLRNTMNPELEEMNALIGKELKVCRWDYYNSQVEVLDEAQNKTWYFNRSDVAELTPLSFKGKRIAIGDWVMWSGRWHLVYDYYWYENGWRISAAREGDPSDCYRFVEDQIESHLPQEQETSMSDEELIRELERRGRVSEGRIIQWLMERRYNCAKGRHKWVYTLSDSGVVYCNDEDVPKDRWHCLNCGIKKNQL